MVALLIILVMVVFFVSTFPYVGGDDGDDDLL